MAILYVGGEFMLYFLTNASIPNLKIKLTWIYILNALDILFTFGLLKTGLFLEVNFLMLTVVDNALLSILIKLIIPAFLMVYILINLDELPHIHLPLCNFAITVVFIIYSLLTCLHLSYTAYFVYTLF